MKGLAGFVSLLFIVVFVVSVVSADLITRPVRIANDASQNVVPTPITEPETNNTDTTGIGVDRDSIITSLEEPDLAFSFTKGADIDNKENYVAYSGGTVVQLIGPENNVTEASSVAYLSSNSVENLSSLMTIAYFTTLIDPEAAQWIREEFNAVSSNPEKEYSNEVLLNGNVYKVEYIRSNLFNSFALTVTGQE